MGRIKREGGGKGEVKGERERRRGMTVRGVSGKQAGGRDEGRVSRDQRIMVTSSRRNCTVVLC